MADRPRDGRRRQRDPHRGPKRHDRKGGGPPADRTSARSNDLPIAPDWFGAAVGKADTGATTPGYAFSVGFNNGKPYIPSQRSSALEQVVRCGNAFRSRHDWGRRLQQRQQCWLERATQTRALQTHWLMATTEWRLTTGLGNEHLAENGFSFAWPYGLPYLPGSGVKGVVRRAAETLADRNLHGWTPARVWLMFGLDAGAAWFGAEAQLDWNALASDPDTARLAVAAGFDGDSRRFCAAMRDRTTRMQLAWRGALTCLDAWIDGDLVVDVLTPHHKSYYEGEGRVPPHDADQPVPVPFLAIEAGARVQFGFVLERYRLPDATAGSWRRLVDAALDEAFEWVGFGAKTSAGYGALHRENRPPMTGDSANA